LMHLSNQKRKSFFLVLSINKQTIISWFRFCWRLFNSKIRCIWSMF
jgi:hypothetical protein